MTSASRLLAVSTFGAYLQFSGCPGGQSVSKTAVVQALCQTPPVLTNCGTPPLADGQYRLVSEFHWRSAPRTNICLDVATQNGTIQQLDCRRVDSQLVFVGGRDQQNCYTLRVGPNGQPGTATGRVLTPNAPMFSTDVSITFGQRIVSQDSRIEQTTCSAQKDFFHWQLKPVPGLQNIFQIKNKATGGCIDMAQEEDHGGGKIQSLDCRQVDSEFWQLKPGP